MENRIPQNELTEMWHEYNQIRVTGDKKTATKRLLDFIDLLKKQDENDIQKFVDNLCELILEEEEKIIDSNGTEVSDKQVRIQFPLFKEIILPVLKVQFKNNSAKHIKWIGQLEQFFYSDKNLTTNFLKELNIEGHFEARYFFEKSFSIGKNQKTLNFCLNRIAQDINFYLHEVPFGVLISPEELEKELNTFRKYWLLSDSKNVWKEDLTQWETIAKHWKLYILNQDEYDSFENYLKLND